MGRKEPSPSNGAGAERGIQPRCACFHPAVRLQDPSCRTGTQRHFQSSPIHLQCRSRGILLHKGLRLPSSGCFPTAPAPGMSEQDMAQAHVNAVACPRCSPVSRGLLTHRRQLTTLTTRCRWQLLLGSKSRAVILHRGGRQGGCGSPPASAVPPTSGQLWDHSAGRASPMRSPLPVLVPGRRVSSQTYLNTIKYPLNTLKHADANWDGGSLPALPITSAPRVLAVLRCWLMFGIHSALAFPQQAPAWRG